MGKEGGHGLHKLSAFPHDDHICQSCQAPLSGLKMSKRFKCIDESLCMGMGGKMVFKTPYPGI
jgi:hypothetical protein